MKLNKKSLMAITLSYLFLSLSTAVISLKVNKKRSRRCSVRPMNRSRNSEGLFATLIPAMLNVELDNEQFFKYCRMSKEQFDFLVKLVRPFVVQKRHGPKVLSVEHRLMLTLHYLAEGCSMQEVAWNYRIGKTTVHIIIKEICLILWQVLLPSQIPVPKMEDWKKISTGFHQKWNLPNCVGAVDGKHVNIQCPKNSGSEYFNYKKNFSLVILAACDADYRFTVVDIGACGSNHDSAVFKCSEFGKALLNNELDLPSPSNLPNTNIKMPFFFAADSAFPLHTNIMRPYPGQYLGEKKNTFNYRLSRGRRTIESAFGILAQRWRVLKKTMVASVEVAEIIVQATVVLHNYLTNAENDCPLAERRYCPTGYADYVDNNGNVHDGQWRNEGDNLQSVNHLRQGNNSARNILQNRDFLADYFVSREGWLPWQESYILRGAMP